MDYPSHSSSGTENNVTRGITRSEEEGAVSEGLERVVMEDAIKVERGEDEDDCLILVSETRPSEGDEDRDGQFVKTAGDTVVKDEAENDGYSWKRDYYDKIDRMLDAIPDTLDSYTIEWPMKEDRQKTENEAMTSTEFQQSAESDDDCVFVSETRPVEEDKDDCRTLVSETEVQPSAESDDDCVFVCETRPVEAVDDGDCKFRESKTRALKRKREDSDDRKSKRILAAMPRHSVAHTIRAHHRAATVVVPSRFLNETSPSSCDTSHARHVPPLPPSSSSSVPVTGFLNHSTLKRKREASADCNRQVKRTLAAVQVPRVDDRCAWRSQFSTTAAAAAVSEVRVAAKERDHLGRGYQKAVCRTETTDEDDRQKAYNEELLRAVASITSMQPPAESDEFSETPEKSDDENRKRTAVGRCVWSPQHPSTTATVPEIRDVRQKPVDEETRRAVALIEQLQPSAKGDEDSTLMPIQLISDTTWASSEKLGENAIGRPCGWSLSQPSVAATTVPDIRVKPDERDRPALLHQKALGRRHNATIKDHFEPAEHPLQAVQQKFKAIPPAHRSVVGRPRSYALEVKTEAPAADNDGATEILASTGTHSPVLIAHADDAPVSRLHVDDNCRTRDQDREINPDLSSDGL